MTVCYKIKFIFLILHVIAFFFTSTPCKALELSKIFGKSSSHWNLPTNLNDDNISVKFEVDTSLHKVNGISKKITGKAWLNNNDYSSVGAEVNLPVKHFYTGNESRDSKLKKVMRESMFPNVVFSITSVKDLCKPNSLNNTKKCNVIINGKLRIMKAVKQLSILSTIKIIPGGYLINGQTSFNWKYFGIKDPSTFLAKVKEKVKINFSVLLK